MNPSEDAGAAPSTTQRNPVLLTGEQYRASLRDGRTVYYRGERIEDITTHPATRGAVSQIAAIYDAQHTAEMRDVLSYVDADGHRVSTAWMLPRSGEDLVRRRAMAEYTARQSFGMYGRHMDMAPTTQVGALAEIGIFQRYSTELAANIPKFIRYAQDNNIMGGGVFVDPQGWRAKRHAGDQLGDDVQPDTGFPANLRITRRDASGFWVSGPKAVGTALPYVHECVVTSAPHKPKDETFWFLVPANSQGVTMVCRSSLADPDESRWQHPLSGRGDEIDVLVLFDDVFVPWERVFMVGEPDFMLNYGPIGNLEYWYMLTRMCVKAELIAAVIRMVVDTLNTTGIQLVRQQVAEVNQYALALRSFIYASEAQARLNDNGAMCPDINIVTAGRAFGIEQYPRILNILQELCGQGSMMQFSQADFDLPEIGTRMEWTLEGHGLSARDKATLFNLVWDLANDGYGSRTAMFEKLNGFPLYLLKERLFAEYDAAADIEEVKRFLDIG